MNFYASTDSQTKRDRALSRVAAGMAISIALHGVLLFAYRQGLVPAWRDDVATPRQAMMVRLRAPEPEPAPLPLPLPEPAAAPKPIPKAKTRTAKVEQPQQPSSRAPAVIALPDDKTDAPAAPDMFTVAPPSASPQFDPDAARNFARKIANEPDPARAGMAVAQIPPKPYATETKAARLIAGAKRNNCKDGLPGGLLAPLILLLDKKDSGCKW